MKARVAALMPGLVADLRRLVELPSVSEVGYPEATQPALLEARDMVARLFESAGCEVESLELPDTAPIVVGGIPAPEGAPTVLLYSHYDVVGAGDEGEWRTPPFEAVVRDGAMRGRGAADTKSNILAHVGALRAWDGRPPVGVKLVIEGQEEVGGGALLGYPEQHPELFAADFMIIGDMGSVRPGVPTHTVALRGMANVTIEVRTLASGKHSGQYGRSRAGWATRAHPRPRHPARRRGRRGGEGPAARPLAGRRTDLGRVSLAGRGRAGPAAHRLGRPRFAPVVRPGDHRDRRRRAQC